MGRLILCFGLVLAILASVSAITNQEFYELLKENSEVVEEYDVPETDDDTARNDDDTISLPGNPDDEVDTEYLMDKLFNEAHKNGDDEPIVGGARCSCRHDRCSCCLRKTWSVKVIWKRIRARLSACIVVEYLPRDFGFRITFTVNGRRLYKHEVSLRHPPRLCYNIPGLGRFARVCAEIYNVNLRRKSLCLRISGELNLIIKKFRIRIKLGCIRIPILTTDWLRAMSEGKELFETALDDETDDTNVAEFFQMPGDGTNNGFDELSKDVDDSL